MRQNVMAGVLVLCFLSFLAQVSWSNEEGQYEPEDITHPLCGACKELCKKTVEVMPIPQGLGCIPFGTVFSSTCEAISGESPASSVLCFAGGGVAKQVCQANYGSPHEVQKDPRGAAKLICKGVKLCK